ncbi:hypothetical protein EDI_255530 [Entamoeba dispar SAW760]|uniref:Uncharacterized protein n=1 Tax=Entamoeba dispar (strain ATCC PRA-260 / SAW760) TaxID=370354 RepID=B0EKB4_ENTDS|nr:uncharacterized protein EDI_255530 [Entamoeba dispar SAW760]EDR25030.1 hypothetical protein EDI_255530 [Entamoeba dispar SAW760]|eukprot:EDR25030.1 hypothetical protein EDI_255530 [Entamoeba dispar SAW760]
MKKRRDREYHRKIVQQQENIKECLFEKIVKCQKAAGKFVGIDTLIKEIDKFKNTQFDQTVVQTFFVVQLLKEKFVENKIEWKLLVKKAEKWLETKQPLPEEIKAQIMSLAKSIILK